MKNLCIYGNIDAAGDCSSRMSFVASLRYTGNYVGYNLGLVGPNRWVKIIDYVFYILVVVA